MYNTFNTTRASMYFNPVVIMLLLVAPLVSPYRTRGSVELFTSRSCRACRAFDKKYTQLVADFPQVEFQKRELRDEDNMKIFNDKNIHAVPCVLFLRDGEEVSRFPAVRKHFQQLEVECAKLSDPHFETL